MQENELSIEDIERAISFHYEKISKICGSKMELHIILQDFIYNMARSFSCFAIKEYKCFDNERGKIDVIWKKKKRILCAFEIDSSYRQKSIRKLKGINAENKIWVVYFDNAKYQNNLKLLENEIKIISMQKKYF
jgi:hypothetical protein